MNRTFATGGLIAGLLFAGWGSLHQSDTVPPPAPTATATSTDTGIEVPTGAMLPIDDIVALWQQRVDEQPLDYLSRTKLGEALGRRGRERADLVDHGLAEVAHREALALNPRHRPAQVGLASALLAQHRFADGRELLEPIVADDPNSAVARALLGDTLLELGDYKAASTQYAELAARSEGASTLARLARLAAVQTTPAEAVDLASRALEAADLDALSAADAAFYWFQLGHHRFGAGDVDGSVRALEAALAIDPSSPAAAEKLAFVLASIGRVDEALARYEDLLAATPSADVEGLYADLLAAEERHDEAAVSEQRAAELAVDTAGRHPAERRHLVGFHVTRDPATAVSLARADLAERADVGAYDALAWALFHSGEIDGADAAIRRALAQGTLDAPLHYHAAAIAAADADTARAVEHLRIVERTNPRFHPFEGPAAAALAHQLAATASTT